LSQRIFVWGVAGWVRPRGWAVGSRSANEAMGEGRGSDKDPAG